MHEPGQYACSHAAASALLNSVSLGLAEWVRAGIVTSIWTGTSQETKPASGPKISWTHRPPLVTLSVQIIVDRLDCAWLHIASERRCLQ